MAWRVHRGLEEVRFLTARDPIPERARRIPADVAASRIDAWFRADDAHRMASICRVIDGLHALRERPEAQRTRLRAALRSGRLRAYRLPIDRSGDFGIAPEEQELAPRETRKEELDFIDIWVTNGLVAPYADEPYLITLPDGEERTGNLDGDGRLRIDEVKHGSFSLALPGIFDATILRDGERLPEVGSGTPLPLPSPPIASSGAPSSDPDEDDEEDEEDDWDDDDDDDDDYEFDRYGVGDAFDDDPFDGPEEGLAQYNDRPETAASYAFYDLRGMTGCAYQLATLHCISVRMIKPDGQWVRGNVAYELHSPDAGLVASAEAEDGIIFVDDVPIGQYELLVDNLYYDVSSSAHARNYALIQLLKEP